jgi:hypothetical protein
MPSYGILRRATVVRTDVSEERSASIIRMTRIDELQTTLALTSYRSAANVVSSSPILVILLMEAVRSSEKSVLTTATRRNIPEDGTLYSHRRENFKSYTALTGWALQQRRNVFPVRYKLRFYIPEDGILHSHRGENLKSYKGPRYFQFYHARYTARPSHASRMAITICYENYSLYSGELYHFNVLLLSNSWDLIFFSEVIITSFPDFPGPETKRVSC